jgi:hypothetical protein
MGTIEQGWAGSVEFVQGTLNVGEAMAVPIRDGEICTAGRGSVECRLQIAGCCLQGGTADARDRDRSDPLAG